MDSRLRIDFGPRLTEKQKKFVINYAGDAGRAALDAGYKSKGVGRDLIQREQILAAIKRRDKLLKEFPQTTDPIMDVEELRKWWTQQILNTNVSITNRITCSKLLAQSYGAFIEPNKGQTANIIVQIDGGGDQNSMVEIESQPIIEVEYEESKNLTD